MKGHCLIPYCGEVVERDGLCPRHLGMSANRRASSAGGLVAQASRSRSTEPEERTTAREAWRRWQAAPRELVEDARTAFDSACRRAMA